MYRAIVFPYVSQFSTSNIFQYFGEVFDENVIIVSVVVTTTTTFTNTTTLTINVLICIKKS